MLLGVVMVTAGCTASPTDVAGADRDERALAGSDVWNDTSSPGSAEYVLPEPPLATVVREAPGCEPGAVSLSPDAGTRSDACWFRIDGPERLLEAWPFQLLVVGEGQTDALPLVVSEAECFGSGWFFDYNLAPEWVGLCPVSCGALGGRSAELKWYCESKPEMPDGRVNPNTPCDDLGSLVGLVCAPALQDFVSGAQVIATAVDCHGNLKALETTSDVDGYFRLDGVPDGQVTVSVTGAGVDVSYSVWVTAGVETDTTSLAIKACPSLLPPDGCFDGSEVFDLAAPKSANLVDIVLVVDTSPSMVEETDQVRKGLEQFVVGLEKAALDAHVILIADGALELGAALAGASGGETASYKPVPFEVDSSNALERIIATYGLYLSHLRADAQTHVVVFTDDDSAQSADWFLAKLDTKEDPGFSSPFLFHSVVGIGDDCDTVDTKGSAYLELSSATGGGVYSICEPDLAVTLEALAEGVIDSSCAFAVPSYTALKNSESLQFSRVLDGISSPLELPQVLQAKDCSGPGFYLVEQPARLGLCPETCHQLTAGELHLDWYCEAP